MQRGSPFLEFTKTLSDMASATHHINGKESLEGSQPGAPAPAMSDSHIDCRV